MNLSNINTRLLLFNYSVTPVALRSNKFSSEYSHVQDLGISFLKQILCTIVLIVLRVEMIAMAHKCVQFYFCQAKIKLEILKLKLFSKK